MLDFNHRRVVPLLALMAVVSFSVEPSSAVDSNIAKTGSCTAQATSCTLDAVSAGDLKIVLAWRNGSTTAPTLASGWTNVANLGAGTGSPTGSIRVGCRKAVDSSDTGTGTWTNATKVVSVALSGTAVGTTANCNTTGFGTLAVNSAKTNATVTFAGMTLTVTNGSSWVLGGAGNQLGTTGAPCVPATMTTLATLTQNSTAANLWATPAGVSSWEAKSCDMGDATGVWVSFEGEVLSSTPSVPRSAAETLHPELTVHDSVIATFGKAVAASATLTTLGDAASVASISTGTSESLTVSASATANKSQGSYDAGVAQTLPTLTATPLSTRVMHSSASATLTTSASPSAVPISSPGQRAAAESLRPALTVSDSVTAVTGAPFVNPTASLTVTATASYTGTFIRTPSEALTTNASALPGNARIGIPTEDLGPADGLICVYVGTNGPSEVLPLSASVTAVVTGASIKTADVEETTPTVTDSAAYLGAMRAASSESLTTTGAVDRIGDLGVSKTENLATVDSLTGESGLTALPVEALSASDEVAILLVAVRSASATLTATASAAPNTARPVTPNAENLVTNAAATVGTTGLNGRSVSDSLSASDSVSLIGDFRPGSQENLTTNSVVHVLKVVPRRRLLIIG